MNENLIKNEDELKKSFLRFYNIIAKLRAPDGCPWDRDQTPLTMRSDLIEETFEAVDAITQKDTEHTRYFVSLTLQLTTAKPRSLSAR